jgi:hypothetical protein
MEVYKIYNLATRNYFLDPYLIVLSPQKRSVFISARQQNLD